MSEFTIKGIYRDRLLAADGRPIFDSGWQPNLIVLNCRKLLAGFMKNDAALGIQELQVGRGDPAWDTTPPPAPDPNTTDRLFDADGKFVIPKANLTLRYLNANNDSVTTPTNRIEIIVTLGPNEPPPVAGSSIYPLREFGLFGALGGAPFMIDYIRHPLFEKDVSFILERRVRLEF